MNRHHLISAAIALSSLAAGLALWSLWSVHHTDQIRVRRLSLIGTNGDEVGFLGVHDDRAVFVLKGSNSQIVLGSVNGDSGLSIITNGKPAVALTAGEDGASILSLGPAEKGKTITIGVTAHGEPAIRLEGSREVGLSAASNVNIKVKEKSGKIVYSAPLGR